MMVIENEYEMGEVVYLITDQDQLPRMVVSITVGPNNVVTYQLAHCTTETTHYQFEVTREKSYTGA